MFAQAERSPDRSSGGLGLGLALVKSLVNLHHGTVSGHSAGPGKGSSFTVHLPRLAGEAQRDSAPASAPPLLETTARLRILVVDDNVDAANMLSMLLEAGGHAVRTEYSARAALELASVEAPQICILDIGLPEMDGNALAQRLRALPHMADAVLVAVTGYGQENDRQQTLAAGFDHHLVKPVDAGELAAILARVPHS
jgi:CheY-like chemotaxis protein